MLTNIGDMAEEIKLSKTDDQPWGFRVTGGLDFGTPVTVIKVTASSLAELAGLKVGDMLLQANGQPLSFMTHHEYSKFLAEAGNFIELVIVRGSLVLPPTLAALEPTATEGSEINKEESQGTSNTKPLPSSEPSLFESIFGPLDEHEDVTCSEDVIHELNDQPSQQLELTIDAQTQNEEAATPVLSKSAAEENDTVVMPEQAGNESQSQSLEHEVKVQTEETISEKVKKELTEEEIVDIMVGPAEVLTGTTIGVDFDKLEPRNDVIEKSQVLQVLKEEESELEKKKLTTFLQVPNRPKVKPKERPKQSQALPKQPEAQTEETPNQEISQNEEQTTESDQPKTEQEVEDTQLTEKEQLEGTELPKEKEEENEINNDTVEQPQAEEPDEINDNKLLDIQSQLTALLQLPAVMQQQLSIIQQQITNIMQQKLAEVNPEPAEEETEAGKEEGAAETDKKSENKDEQQELQDSGEELQDGGEEKEIAEEGQKVADTNQNVDVDQDIEGETDKLASMTENPDTQPQNETNEETSKEEHKRDIKRERPKKNKPLFPLTPHPRPIVLPGRIKFQMNPEEAYDDDFIAETLSGNAEVIKGTALGVNFQKYHRSYDHLKSSSVYRMIHETDKRHPGAFEGRPYKIPALEDYKQLLQNGEN
ncbi:harmonin isoform X2 [Zootermopsis nevadensis]|uniref:harmonin isoform X2 n=1 Tax=Zootermopsis nevadensis TaxID=136037 RepID=UPI000B8E6C03|nr:harmonin isoform X2 [Zootermopsis nevadensis]